MTKRKPFRRLPQLYYNNKLCKYLSVTDIKRFASTDEIQRKFKVSNTYCSEERGTANSRCGIVTVGLTRSTLHTVNYPTWSGVFNKMKFDHDLLKKKKKTSYVIFTSLSSRLTERQTDC